MKSKPKPKIEDHVFSKEEIETLKSYRDHQNDGRLKQRFIALILIAECIDISTVLSVIGISLSTLQRWFLHYLDNIDRLNSFNYKPKATYLDEKQIQELIKWVKEKMPTTKEIRDFIDDHYNVLYSLDAVRKLLKRNGMKQIRPKLIPGDPPSLEKQVEVIMQYHQINEWREFGVIQLFGDAMHLVHQVVPGACWGDPKDPPIYKSNSGRQRLNILGAYDSLDPNLVHHSTETSCDASQVIVYLEKIIDAYPQYHTISLRVDNASYFHAKKVKEWLEEHPQLVLEFIPAYAPNLNLIERLWRFAKEKLVRNTYYALYKTFRAHAFRLLNNIHKYADELSSLINGNFELIY